MDVSSHERLSRFLFFRRWFAREKSRVKPDAFIPHPYIELSVACTEGLEENTIWEIGNATAAARSDAPPLLGRADLLARDVFEQDLTLDRNDNPQYHANILGWSAGGKEAQRMQAVELAAKSSLHLV